MTRKEAIKLLVNATYSDEWQGNEDLTTAHNMSIKALEILEEFEKAQKYKTDFEKGRVLTPDGIRLIVKANNYNPEGIGKDILRAYAKMRNC